MAHEHQQMAGEEWVSFPGGELEGKRPKVFCRACRDALARRTALRTPSADAESVAQPCSACSACSAASRPPPPGGALLCFACYRAGLERERRLHVAGELNTASDARFQTQLPFEAVDKPRLEMLKADRTIARTASVIGAERFADKRRQAQITARHALQALGDRLNARELAARAAELQLPESWLPFVMSR